LLIAEQTQSDDVLSTMIVCQIITAVCCWIALAIPRNDHVHAGVRTKRAIARQCSNSAVEAAGPCARSQYSCKDLSIVQ
jgi:hypothetical protein